MKKTETPQYFEYMEKLKDGTTIATCFDTVDLASLFTAMVHTAK